MNLDSEDLDSKILRCCEIGFPKLYLFHHHFEAGIISLTLKNEPKPDQFIEFKIAIGQVGFKKVRVEKDGTGTIFENEQSGTSLVVDFFKMP